MATIWLFTPSIQYRFLPSQSTATESARIPVRAKTQLGIRTPTLLHLCPKPTFNQSACGLVVQWGPPDAVSVHRDPEDPLLLPVIVHREYCLLGRGWQHIKAAAAQAQQKQVRLDRGQQQGFALWMTKSQYFTPEQRYKLYTPLPAFPNHHGCSQEALFHAHSSLLQYFTSDLAVVSVCLH